MRAARRKAMQDAESDVMRATATPPGGRKEGEDLMAYVERTKQIQGAAIARWMTAKAELEAVCETCTIDAAISGGEGA